MGESAEKLGPVARAPIRGRAVGRGFREGGAPEKERARVISRSGKALEKEKALEAERL